MRLSSKQRHILEHAARGGGPDFTNPDVADLCRLGLLSPIPCGNPWTHLTERGVIVLSMNRELERGDERKGAP